MIWEYIGATLIFTLIGYLIGSISNAVILTKMFKNEDVRTKGSGNAGATNTLRNYGKKIAFAVFILDIAKVVLAVVIAWSVKEYSGVDWLSGMLIQGAALGAIIGHVWPIFFKFKGGKGAATAVGLFLSMQWILVIIGIILFIFIVFKTRKVSLGALLGILILIIIQVIFHFIPHMEDTWSMPMMSPIGSNFDWWVNTLFLIGMFAIVVVMHIPNIKRILNGTERTIGK